MYQKTMLLRNTLLLLLCLSGITGFAQHYTTETIPNPKKSSSPDYVSNPDHILTSPAVSKVNSILRTLEDSTTAQVAVVCVNSIGDAVPKEFATALFRKWGLGYQQKNNGMLILLVNDQHRIEMETGYGLEGLLPDAVCKRIQVEKMIPLARQGNFDGAVIEGASEIAKLLNEPVAKAEVYDSSKYDRNKPLDNYAIFVVFLLFILCLFGYRTIVFIFKKRNPVADQVEKTISKTKLRWLRGSLVYIVLPLLLGWIVIGLRAALSLPGWQILVIMYAYAVAVALEAQWRRKTVFYSLVRDMPEPDRYAREKALGFSNWLNMLLFPVPFVWLKIQDNKKLNQLRNHPRQTPDGEPLEKIKKSDREDFLTDYQKIELQLKTVDYDVWRNEKYHVTQAIGYENMETTEYERCSKCSSKAMYFTGSRILSAATTEREGRGVREHDCKACGHRRETQYSIPMSSKATDTDSSRTYSSTGSSSSSWGSSSGSSSSSSSWGGGSSGGGGAGSSW